MDANYNCACMAVRCFVCDSYSCCCYQDSIRWIGRKAICVRSQFLDAVRVGLDVLGSASNPNCNGLVRFMFKIPVSLKNARHEFAMTAIGPSLLDHPSSLLDHSSSKISALELKSKLTSYQQKRTSRFELKKSPIPDRASHSNPN
jgi:predicted enzyme involved in methoxymalonyl-ACP biosynthesis